MFRRVPKSSSFERLHARILSQWLVASDNRPVALALASRTLGEGVTTVTAGLARAFAGVEPGGVVVVDTVGGRRSAARCLGLPEKPIACATLGQAEADRGGPEKVAEKAGVAVVTLVRERAAALPDARTVQAAIDGLKGRYRAVLIDCGTLGDAAAAGWLACADYRLLVVDVSQATREVLEYQARQLEHSGVPFDGSILNRRPDYIPRIFYPLVR